MRRLLTGRRGFTTVELVAASAIGAMAAGLLAQAILHLNDSVSLGAARLGANSSAANAIIWIGRDFQMAVSTDLPDAAPPAASVTLSWIDRYAGADEPHQVSYAVVAGELRRIFDGVEAMAARTVESVQFSRTGQVVTAIVRVNGQDHTIATALRPGG